MKKKQMEYEIADHRSKLGLLPLNEVVSRRVTSSQTKDIPLSWEDHSP